MTKLFHDITQRPHDDPEYMLRLRILKLRWLGMEDEANHLLAMLGYGENGMANLGIRLPISPVTTD